MHSSVYPEIIAIVGFILTIVAALLFWMWQLAIARREAMVVAQENLKKSTVSKNYLNNIINSLPNMLIILNSEAFIEQVNPAGLIGYQESALLNKPLTILLTDKNLEKMNALIKDSIAKSVETIFMTKDGNEIPVLFSSTVNHDASGNITEIVCSAQDISDLRESEKKYKVILETAADAIITIDEHCIIQSVNHATLKLFEYDLNELVDKNINILMPSPYHENHNNYVNNYIQTGKRKIIGISREVEAVSKSGKKLPIYLTVSEFFIGNKRFFTGIIRDISELVETREQLFQSQRMDSLGQLAGGIAHDFNNILGIILGEIGLLKRYNQRHGDFPEHPSLEDNPKHRHSDLPAQTHFEVIKVTAQRAAELTQKLLGFARKGQYESNQLQLNTIIEETQTILSNTLSKNIDITCELDPALWPIVGDSSQLSQVIMNLCINARDAMPKGGVISIKTENVTSDHTVDGENEHKSRAYIRLTVSDIGCGIKPEYLEKIYEPFFTTKPKEEGTGLGLSLIYGIVENHKGSIKVDSELNKGTVFVLHFPAEQGTERTALLHEADLANTLDNTDLGDMNLLVVDDEAFLVDIAIGSLSFYGINVTGTTDPLEALAYFEGNDSKFNIVLLDISMPTMSGYDLFLQIRKQVPDQAVIFTSGYTESDELKQYLKKPRVGFVQKPYEATDLIAEIQRVLG